MSEVKIDCKTCKGSGSIEFERGAVVKPCATCRATGRDAYAECESLRAENEFLRECQENCHLHIMGLAKERDQLRAELAALKAVPDGVRRDARRYRFLMRELGGSVSQIVMGSPVFSDEDVAAAIDAAMATQEVKQ